MVILLQWPTHKTALMKGVKEKKTKLMYGDKMVKRLKTMFHEDAQLRKVKIQVGRRAVLE